MASKAQQNVVLQPVLRLVHSIRKGERIFFGEQLGNIFGKKCEDK